MRFLKVSFLIRIKETLINIEERAKEFEQKDKKKLKK